MTPKRSRGRISSRKNETPFGRRLREVIGNREEVKRLIEREIGIRRGETSSYLTGSATVSPQRMLAIVDALPGISEEERLSLHWAGALTAGFEIGPDPTPRAGDFQI